MANKISYAEKLKDPRWQRKRLEIMSRDYFTCRECRSTDKTLHVHHKDYIKGREPWDYPDEYLVTLCYACHEEVPQRETECFAELMRRFKVKMENQFDMRCCVEVFEKYKDLSDLIYLLWELSERQEAVMDALRTLFQEECAASIERHKDKIGELTLLSETQG